MDKKRMIIPALDVTELQQIETLISKVDRHDLVYGYKIGFSLGLSYGLPKVVETIRRLSSKPVIYDHQKAATDIPDTGKLFARVMKESRVDEVILFPQAGPATLEAWISALAEQELTTIVGGIMTHPRFVQSEGGFISDGGVVDMYRIAYEHGVRRFVVPLTKPQATAAVIREAGLDERCVFYSPGYGQQGGDPAAFAFLNTHYLIIGRSLLRADDPVAYLDEVKIKLAGLA
jgi:orotidine-5'-phosphate decarboxylase